MDSAEPPLEFHVPKERGNGKKGGKSMCSA